MEKLCVMTDVNKNQDGTISLSGTEKIDCPDPSVVPSVDPNDNSVDSDDNKPISGAYLSFPDEHQNQPQAGGSSCSVENLKQKDHDIIKSFICKQIKKKLEVKKKKNKDSRKGKKKSPKNTKSKTIKSSKR